MSENEMVTRFAQACARDVEPVAMNPCPWCGGEVGPIVEEGATFRWRRVTGCCANGPEVRHDTLADDQAAAEVESRAAAIAAWNERPVEVTLRAQLEAAEAEAEQQREWADRFKHMVITCGVAATHPDPNLTLTGAYKEKWNSQQADSVRALRARAEAAEAEAVNLRAGNIAYSQQVNELIGRAGKAEADAKEKFQQYVDANEARIDLERLIVPGLRVYKGDHVVQIDAGKVGLFTERYSGDEDLPRAMSVLQNRAIDAARTKEAAP